MENIKVNVAFTNTSKDLWNFRRFKYSKSWWKYVLGSLIFSIPFTVGILFSVFTKKIFNFEYQIGVFIVSFLTVFIYFHCLIIGIWHGAGIEKKFFLEKKLSFEKEKVILDFGFEKLETNWSYFDKMEQNKDYIFLYISKLNVIIIPKTAFQSELETFFQLAKDNNLN